MAADPWNFGNDAKDQMSFDNSPTAVLTSSRLNSRYMQDCLPLPNSRYILRAPTPSNSSKDVFANSTRSTRDARTPRPTAPSRDPGRGLEGSRRGDLEGSRRGDLEGSRRGDLEGSRRGDLEGSRRGDLEGSRRGDLEGSRRGDLEGSRRADIEGSSHGPAPERRDFDRHSRPVFSYQNASKTGANRADPTRQPVWPTVNYNQNVYSREKRAVNQSINVYSQKPHLPQTRQPGPPSQRPESGCRYDFSYFYTMSPKTAKSLSDSVSSSRTTSSTDS